MTHFSQDSQNFQGYNENLTELISSPFENNNNNDNIVTTNPNFFNDSFHENEHTVSVPLTHYVTPKFQSTSRTISQQKNVPFMYQKFQRISNSILIFEENAKRQLEQLYELKNHLNQLKQFLNTQQQHSMPRRINRINRNRDYRTHPYLNERQLVTSHISTATEIDCHYDNNELNFMNEQNILSNSFCPQQVNVPAAVNFSENSEILTSPQNFEFYDNNYNVHEI